MANVPQLKVFYVDVIEDKKKTEGKKGIGKAAAKIAEGLDTAKDAVDPLIREIKPHAIKTGEELQRYHNPLGNAWVESDKVLGIRQLYIRHPKKQYAHLLIEAEHFYDYVEDEYYNELYNYILSHCKPKLIKVDKKTKANIGIDLEINNPIVGKKKKEERIGGATLDYSKNKGNYMALEFRRSPFVQPFSQYVWLEKSLMTAINGLTKGARLSKRVVVKNSFGLNAGLAKRIGLDAKACKDYELKIYIEC